MLTTALLLMLATADVQPAFLTDGAPRAVRLIAEDLPELPSYEGWTKGQLRAEYERLKELRPGIGGPIALMASGGAVLTLALYIVFIGLGSGGNALPFLIMFGIVGTAGAACLIIGGIVMARALPDRRLYGVQMDEVDRLIKVGDEAPRPEEDPVYLPPEPPPLIGPPPEGPPPLPLPPFTPQSSISFPLIFARF